LLFGSSGSRKAKSRSTWKYYESRTVLLRGCKKNKYKSTTCREGSMGIILQKYPRTPHLPWSPGATTDDKVLSDTSIFEGQEVVVTEKLDGECTTIHREGVYARSLNSTRHVSRDYVTALAATFRHELPDAWRLIGECVYAKHSIYYTHLPGYFIVFAIHTNEECLSWDDTEGYAKLLRLPTVPVLYRGIWDPKIINTCWNIPPAFGDLKEGYVVRLTRAFLLDTFATSIAKYVRRNHVQTDEHWLHQPLTVNLLKR